ncbi:hypothetical protein NP493_368g01018 [Ridgeia piscesae]|uniref:Uncharacterized protein n=1 Tax=Ridgeia piscesae TaxID=27915 RepID=A0AAD9L3E1_RIDPI|nr:hypothetical protein NP493_368g01018 [Ridgeia piscesae]
MASTMAAWISFSVGASLLPRQRLVLDGSPRGTRGIMRGWPFLSRGGFWGVLTQSVRAWPPHGGSDLCCRAMLMTRSSRLFDNEDEAKAAAMLTESAGVSTRTS